MKRKIAVITGSRAEYGLLRWLIDELHHAVDFELQLIVTGMHLSPEFGLTYKEIEKDGYPIVHCVEMLLSSDSSVGVTKSMGLGLIGFADAFALLTPDLVIVLGDRFEIFAAASAAMVARIPIAHLHGGESTQGAYDEAFRHAITKMSHLHFVAAEPYRQRVMQLGEDPQSVFTVGGLGLDNIRKLTLLTREDLAAALNLSWGSKNLLITFHPCTLEKNSAEAQIEQLLEALDTLEDTHLIFTMPNADDDHFIIRQRIEAFAKKHPHAYIYTSLGQLLFLSCLQFVDGVVGNSSSGLIEVPSFKKGTVNIGHRQTGRIKAESVIDCQPTVQAILDALRILYSPAFKNKLKSLQNPYGNGYANERIMRVLRGINFRSLGKKVFYDMPVYAE